MLHYFVFQLRPQEEAPADADSSFALFTMRWEDNEPVSAVVITPSPSGNQAEVVNLRDPAGAVQTVPLGAGNGLAPREDAGPGAP